MNNPPFIDLGNSDLGVPELSVLQQFFADHYEILQAFWWATFFATAAYLLFLAFKNAR